MEIKSITKAWEKREYHPVYWLEGEEAYYIDQLTDYAQKNILSPEQFDFNLSVFYGKDSDAAQVVNACMRYPVFSDRQLIILKEAQHLKDIEKLESYILNPLSSTILIIAFKEKKIDGRSKFAKLIKDHTVFFQSLKLKENELAGWINDYILSQGYKPTRKTVFLLAEHIGNDLSKIVNEIDKLFIHLSDRKEITEEDIESCIGISKEYNLFELQHAIGKKDFSASFRILQYFEHNPKAAPLQLLLPILYSYFSKVYMLLNARGDDKSIAAQTGINAWFMKDYRQTASIYGHNGIEAVMLLLHAYNLKSVGVNNTGNNDAALMKELLGKMMIQN
ncbi:MAG: DNA polymerase III subunit delta [Bacteroidota bacterium]|jgi:DNA polymerase-3 subunit delta